jgi:hypothetical protein
LGNEVARVAQGELPIGESGRRASRVYIGLRPERGENLASGTLTGAKVVSRPSMLLQHLEQLSVANVGAVPERLVVQHVVTVTEEVRPITGLWDLQQPVIVAVLCAEPDHGPIQLRSIAFDEVELARGVYVVVEGDDHP